MNKHVKNNELCFASQSLECARQLNYHNVAIEKAEPVKGRGVFAMRAFLPGECVIIGLVKSFAEHRTNYSIQLFWDVHANFEEPAIVINHSCGPNVAVSPNRFGAYDFIALVEIKVGDEICFDYATTEYESISVPECSCGAKDCRSRSGGYSLLGEDHQLKEAGLVAPYLSEEKTQTVSRKIISETIVSEHQ
jgi:hypothetical protein